MLAPLDLAGCGGAGDGRFDSIGLNYVLHCLPGDFTTKQAAFGHLGAVVNDGGVLFGITLLGRGVPRNALARWLMGHYNRRGIFANLQDDLPGLRRALAGLREPPLIEPPDRQMAAASAPLTGPVEARVAVAA